MKRQLVWHKSFLRAFKKVTKRNTARENNILTALQLLTENPFHPLLDTHKLHGALQGYWACSAEYDCRIVFSIVKETSSVENIVLIDIGTHDEVY